MTLRHFGAVSALALFLVGCAQAPKPDLTPLAPASWSHPPATDAAIRTTDWWRAFENPDLDAWVSKAVAKNYDLKSAQANLAAARAIMAEAHAANLPAGTADMSLQRLRQSAAAQPPGVAPGVVFADQTLLDQGVSLGWEMDLGGRIRGLGDTARASLILAQWQTRQAQAAVVAQTVRAYLDWHEAVGERAIIAQRLNGLQAIEALQTHAWRAGAVTDEIPQLTHIDIERLKAAHIQLEARVDSAARQLLALTGETPVASAASVQLTDLKTPRALPGINPQDTLRLRPDVGIAEANVRQAMGQAEINRADLYPTITLIGSAGQTGDPKQADADASFRFSVGPQLSWGVFNWERTQARIRSSDSRTEAAYMQWHAVTLNALRESEDAIEAWTAATASEASARRAAAIATRMAKQMHHRRDNGLVSQLDALKADDTRLLAEADEIQAQYQTLQAWSQACLAMGAGWSDGKTE